jgi:GTPase
MEVQNKHKAGFVAIVGKPNVGKSTLMNALIGEKLSIVTSKAQTTRHRIMGFINGEDFQIIYSDTPGVLKPQYELHKSMMKFVNTSLEDSDVVLLLKEMGETPEKDEFIENVIKTGKPIFFILNKIDTSNQEEVETKLKLWQELIPCKEVLAVSALEKFGIESILPKIIELLPEHPPYFDKEDYTDKPERFFAAEIIREKILLNYQREIPYSSEVVITSFKEDTNIIRIMAEIFVERDSQKGIIIGHKGAALKKVGIQARKEMEAFFMKQIHLETHVKVEPDWRSKEKSLHKFGYNSKD